MVWETHEVCQVSKPTATSWPQHQHFENSVSKLPPTFWNQWRCLKPSANISNPTVTSQNWCQCFETSDVPAQLSLKAMAKAQLWRAWACWIWSLSHHEGLGPAWAQPRLRPWLIGEIILYSKDSDNISKNLFNKILIISSSPENFVSTGFLFGTKVGLKFFLICNGTVHIFSHSPGLLSTEAWAVSQPKPGTQPRKAQLTVAWLWWPRASKPSQAHHYSKPTPKSQNECQNLKPSTNASKPTMTHEATLILLKPHQTRTHTHEIPWPAPRVRVLGTGRGHSGDTPGLPVPITSYVNGKNACLIMIFGGSNFFFFWGLVARPTYM